MKTFTFTTNDGNTERVYYIEAPASAKTLLVFHEWWGLNDHIKSLSERLALVLPGVNILALDLYHGEHTNDPLRAEALKKSLTHASVLRTVSAAIEKFAEGHMLASIGYCMGGMWSLQSAISAGNSMQACVLYYGMPELNIEKLKTLHAPVLGIFGELDPWISPQVVGRFQHAMKEAGKTLIVRSFPADHAFANPSSHGYDAHSTQIAWQTTIAFLREKLSLSN